jgi:TP901 family phage tail tape measure protein
MSLGTDLTVLLTLQAIDKASAVIDRIDGAFDAFNETVKASAASAAEAGKSIDDSLLQTASGADAVDLATARMDAAGIKLTAALDAQANAERTLLEAHGQLADAGTLDAAAMGRQVDAVDQYTAAQRRAAVAAKGFADAQASQAAVAEASAAASAAATDTATDAQERLDVASSGAAESSGIASKAFGIAGLAVAAVGYESVKAAGNFQSLTEHLVTDAGESQSQLAKVQAGILGISTATGTSATDVANAMYHVESAGFHAANGGLDVLRIAAEGAKVGNADLDTVSKSLVGTMNAYGAGAGSAASYMNQLIATVGSGDLKMQDLATSLSSVSAVAASAHIPFAQVGAAIATMTAQNMTAQAATQDLGHTIGALQNPSNVQIKEMQAMGLSSAQVSKELGTGGLTGTFAMLTKAIAEHTKGGAVLISTFNSSAQAAADANTMIQKMTPSMQNLARSYLNGSITSQQWTNDLKAMDPVTKGNMSQFATLADKTHQFNSELASGSQPAQTYTAAMSKLMGGSVGLKTALMLTGSHTETLNKSFETISKSAKTGGSTVENWGKIQQTFNQKMDKLKSSVEASGISIGMALLPAVSKVATIIGDIVGPMARWITQNEKWVGLGLAVAGAIGAVVMAMKAWEIVQGVMNGLTAIFAAEEAAILSPVELVVIAIAALVAGVIYAYTHFKTFHDIVVDVFHAVKDAAVATWHGIDDAFHAIVTAGKAVGTAAVDMWHAIETAWDDVSGAAKDTLHAIVTAWGAVTSFFSDMWGDIEGMFGDAVQGVEGIVKGWYPVILGVLSGGILLIPALIYKYWSQITGFVSKAWNDAITFIKSVPGKIEAVFAGAASWLLQEGEDVIDGLINGAKAVFKDITTALNTAKNDITGAFSDAGTWLWDTGKSIIDGLIGGIKSAFGDVKSTLSSLTSWIPSWKGPPSTDAVLLKDNGALIMQGLIDGISSKTGDLHSQLQTVTKTVAGTFGSQYTAGIATRVAASIAAAQTTTPAGPGASPLTVGPGLAALPAGGAGGGNVYLTVDLRGASVTSDADITRLTNRIGRVVATKLLPQSGVRIRA